MGDGLFIKCKDCKNENEYLFGAGFLFSSFESVLELLPGRKMSFAKEILKNNKNTKSQFDGYEVYQCEICASVQNTFFLETSDENEQVESHTSTMTPLKVFEKLNITGRQ